MPISGYAQGHRPEEDIIARVRMLLEQNKQETIQMVHDMVAKIGIEEPQNGAYEPTRADRICQYLNMLYEAQRTEHNVHDEITEALKELRKEAGI